VQQKQQADQKLQNQHGNVLQKGLLQHLETNQNHEEQLLPKKEKQSQKQPTVEQQDEQSPLVVKVQEHYPKNLPKKEKQSQKQPTVEQQDEPLEEKELNLTLF